MSKSNELTTKRFVIRKSLIGKNVVITFTNKKGDVCTYNHDDVYNKKKEQAFKLSRSNRKESDRLEKEANDILIELDRLKIDEKKN